MKLELVGKNNQEVKSVELEKFIENVRPDSFYYFNKETSYKTIMDLIDRLKDEKNFSVYFREVKYGLEENDYMYEMHII